MVLTSGDRHKRDIAITDFDPRDLKGIPLNEIPHKIIYICPKYVNEETPEPYREWMTAINDSLDEMVDESAYTRTEIRKIFQHIEKESISPSEKAKMFDEHAWEQRDIDKMEEGKKLGIKEKADQTARNLISLGKLTHEQIAEATGLKNHSSG